MKHLPLSIIFCAKFNNLIDIDHSLSACCGNTITWNNVDLHAAVSMVCLAINKDGSPLPTPGSTLLEQTDGHGRTPLDLVSKTPCGKELLRSAQVGDASLRNRKESAFLNLPLLEFGSTLLVHIFISYQKEKGLSIFTELSDGSHGLGYRLLQALEGHSLQKVTLGWMDQRTVRLMQDAEMLLELGKGNCIREMDQAVKECKEENTLLLMKMVENLKSSGTSLVSDLSMRCKWYICLTSSSFNIMKFLIPLHLLGNLYIHMYI